MMTVNEKSKPNISIVHDALYEAQNLCRMIEKLSELLCGTDGNAQTSSVEVGNEGIIGTLIDHSSSSLERVKQAHDSFSRICEAFGIDKGEI